MESDINTITLNIADADYVEREGSTLSNSNVTSDYTYRTFANNIEVVDIGVYPAKNDKVFLGWAETVDGEVISSISLSESDTHNALRGITSKTLYPIYKDGTVPSTSYSYSNGEFIIKAGKITTTVKEFVIPDYYVDSNNSGKVTSMEDPSTNTAGLLYGNSTIIDMYVGRYVKNFARSTCHNCTILKNVYLPNGLESIGNNNYQATEASGQPVWEGELGEGEARSTVLQNYLEGSNVQLVDEMVNLIVAQRAYEINSKIVQAADDMLSQANNLKR
jgi:flagellar basal body rod protein FlgG